uniref:Retrotransposon gag domain-containing protein n=1 Tax=Megaselia scalaris TaxID=36166 RepID=T1GK77_MEGSC
MLGAAEGTESEQREEMTHFLSTSVGELRENLFEMAESFVEKLNKNPISTTGSRMFDNLHKDDSYHAVLGCGSTSPNHPLGTETNFNRDRRSNYNRMHATNEFDIAATMDMVRKWNIKFSGLRKSQDAIVFLERIERMAHCYQLNLNVLPRAMPVLLSGDAEEWYSNNSEEWSSWVEFKESFCLFFVPERFREQLEDEIAKYVQLPKQSIKEYALGLQSLLRLAPSLTEEDKLNRIYKNSRKNIKIMSNEANLIL